MVNDTKTQNQNEMKELLEKKEYFEIPKIGDVVKGTIISANRRAVYMDIGGRYTGVVRGRELFSEAEDYADLKPGDEVEATVMELENENGEMELSFRYAGHRKAWDNLQELLKSEEPVMVKIKDANKGGLMVTLFGITGFLPVSQLTAEHYPRVQGGDKTKILEKLKNLTGEELKVKVIDANERNEKLIVSEKAAWEEKQQEMISQYKVGDAVEGVVTAVTDFGVFMKFDNLEGLVHISELAWQRIDDPRDIIKVGEKVKAEIINIDGSKIFLSIKKLQDDPWKDVDKKYKTGETVEGKVIKANPFGLFVELDKDIHGLAHISELSDKTINNIEEIAKPGDKMKFKIISIEPEHHRLGLSLKQMKKSSAKDEKEPKEEKPEEKKGEGEKESKEEKKEVAEEKPEEKK